MSKSSSEMLCTVLLDLKLNLTALMKRQVSTHARSDFPAPPQVGLGGGGVGNIAKGDGEAPKAAEGGGLGGSAPQRGVQGGRAPW